MKKSVMFSLTGLTSGGAERVVSVWASALAERGYQVHILLAGHMCNEYPVSDKVNIHTIAPTYTEYQELSRFEQYRRRKALINSITPQCIISFLPHIQEWTLLTTLGTSIKCIETTRVDPYITEKGMNVVGRLLWMWSFARASFIIVQTKSQTDFFTGSNLKKCVVIPNPVSDVFIENQKTVFTDRATRFVAAGRISQQKNHNMMIEAFALAHRYAPDITLEIYGDDERHLAGALTARIEALNLCDSIHLMGRTTDLASVYRNADCFLLSSNHEGMPNALAEAMACGLVCISTDCRTGPSDLIDDGINGYLVKIGDVDALSEKIVHISDMSASRRKELGELARTKVLEKCSRERSIEALCSVIDSL